MTMKKIERTHEPAAVNVGKNVTRHALRVSKYFVTL